jgi:hypothetical protein
MSENPFRHTCGTPLVLVERKWATDTSVYRCPADGGCDRELELRPAIDEDNYVGTSDSLRSLVAFMRGLPDSIVYPLAIRSLAPEGLLEVLAEKGIQETVQNLLAEAVFVSYLRGLINQEEFDSLRRKI